MGLAGSRCTFEQQPAAGAATHFIGKSTVGEEEVERTLDFFLQRSNTHHVIEADIDLFGAVGNMRRATGDH